MRKKLIGILIILSIFIQSNGFAINIKNTELDLETETIAEMMNAAHSEPIPFLGSFDEEPNAYKKMHKSKAMAAVSYTDKETAEIQAQASVSGVSSYYDSFALPSQRNGVTEPHLTGISAEESISPFDGRLRLNISDINLPGKNGLDLNLSRHYNSELSSPEHSDASGEMIFFPTTYLMERFGIGLGWSLSIPSVEIRNMGNDLKQCYYHDGTGAVYRSNANDDSSGNETLVSGYLRYGTNLDNFYTDNVKFKEHDTSYVRNGVRSQYSFKQSDGTMQYFAKEGQLIAIKDRFNNELQYDYTYEPGGNLIPGYTYNGFTFNAFGWSVSNSKNMIIYNSSSSSSSEAKSYSVNLDDIYDEYYVRMAYFAPEQAANFSGTIEMYCDLYNGSTLKESVLIKTESPSKFGERVYMDGSFSISELNIDGTVTSAKLRVKVKNGKNTIQFGKFLLAPKVPLISKITDTIGRKIEFEYTGDLYMDYTRYVLPMNVCVRSADNQLIRRFSYYRFQYIYYSNDSEDNIIAENRFFLHTGWERSDNEEDFDENFSIGYDYKTGSASSKYSNMYPYTYEMPLVSYVRNRNSKTYYEYEMVKRWIDNRPKGSTSSATSGNTGFVDSWRISKRYDVNNSQDNTEPNINTVTYNYTSGFFTSETGYNKRTLNGMYPGFLDPDRGKYIVTLSHSNGGVETYEYTSHTFLTGYRRAEDIVLPLLDRHKIKENSAETADCIIREYSYDDNFAIISPTKIKTTETVNSVSNITYTKNEYYAISSLLSKQSIPLTDEEAEQTAIPERKAVEYEYTDIGSHTYLQTAKKYYKDMSSAKLSQTYEYDALGRIISSVNENGHATEYTYDESYPWLVSSRKIQDPDNMGNAAKCAEVRYTYENSEGLGATKTLVKYNSDSYAQTTVEYEFKYGNIIKSTNENGKTTSYSYDGYGRLKSVGYPNIITKDGESEYWESISYNRYFLHSDNRYYQKITIFKEWRNETLLYDDFGNIVYRITPNGTEQYIYDNSGRVSGYKNCIDYGGTGNTQTYEYDGLNRLVSVADKSGNKSKAVYKSLSAEYSYVPAGSTTPENHFTSVFDIYGRKISEKTYPNGINGTPSTALYEYDLVGNLTKATDPNGNITEYFYDNVGNKIKTVKPDGTVTEYRYTKQNAVSDTVITDTDGNKIIMSALYDERGKNISFEQKGLDIFSRPWYYNYNVDGSLDTVTNPNGSITSYEYDDYGNIKSYKDSTDVYDLYYRLPGQVSEIISKDIETIGYMQVDDDYYSEKLQYEYDDMGRVLFKMSSRYEMQYTEYAYNTLDKLMGITKPSDGYSANYSYDSLGRVSAITYASEDAFSDAFSDVFSYEYYADGMVKKITYPNGSITVTYTYDNANRLTQTVTKKGENALRTYNYTYDANGNILTVSGSENVSYTYDELNRLKSSTKNNVTTTYTYDSRNNLISEVRTGYRKIYEYGDDNRLKRTVENGVETTYEYDLNGNLLIRNSDTYNVPHNFGYDEKNRLKYANVDNGQGDIWYTVNLEGLMCAAGSDRNDCRYIYDENGNIIISYVGNGAKMLTDGNHPLAMYTEGEKYYYIYNGHGDVTALVDENGNIVNSYSYDPWGSIESETEAVENRFKYAGEYEDKWTGFVYLRNRYYDTKTRRFIQEDPARDELNWYAYCGNNPVNYVDPWGLYYIEKDAAGQVYAVIESGDTLSNISYSEVADATAYLKLNYAEPGFLEIGQRVNITEIYNDNYPIPTNIALSKTRHTQGDTGLRDIPDEEISRRARDKTLSGEERRRYQREEKLRGQRNKQKRQSHYSVQQSQLPYPNATFLPAPHSSIPEANISDSQFWEKVAAGAITIIGIAAGIYYFCYTGDTGVIYQYAQ